MYLNITTRKDERKYLSIVHGYRDEQGKVKKKTIKSLGYLDELEKEFEDPISHFKALAKKMDDKRKLEDISHDFSINKKEKLSTDTDTCKNYGYIALSKIYHELNLNNFIKNKQRHSNDDFDANLIMQTIVYLRLISSSSRETAYKKRNLLFEKDKYSEEDFYKGLIFLYKHKASILNWLNEKIHIHYGRKGTMVYYNIHNYCSPAHVIKMGIFTDKDNIPVTYDLFPCTGNYSSAYRPDLAEIKSNFKMNRMLTVSDKAILNGDSIWKIINTPSNDGYIFNIPVNSTCRELKQYISNESGYQWADDEYKRKSRISSRPIEITLNSGEKITKIIEEKQVVFYSPKYAKRAKGNAFDGYYVLFTSELEDDEDKIIDTYRNLWNMEKYFRLTRDELESRPYCISVHDYIEIQILSCFIATILIKLLQKKTAYKYSIHQLLSSISKANCVRINENLYLFNYYDEVLKTISASTGIPFDNKIMPLSDIKKVLSNVKK